MLDPNYLSKSVKAYRTFLDPVYQKNKLTKIELDILLFLDNYPQYDTASEIVKRRMLTKSHVSSAVNTLYDKGFINKIYRNKNKKTVHLLLLPKAKDIVRQGRKAQHLFIASLRDGLLMEEIIFFEKITQKMMRNIDTILEEEQHV